jgi:hypothetical protein
LRTLLLFSQTPEEVTQVFKTITRTRTLLLTLRLPPNADISALTNYWSGGFADADTLPMLQAANQRDSVTEIDVLHLMPALARRRLYTYPTLDQTIDGRLPDCHWTSLNFYNNNARSYYLDTRLAAGALLSQYDRVNAPYRFGDVLAFISTDMFSTRASISPTILSTPRMVKISSRPGSSSGWTMSWRFTNPIPRCRFKGIV